MIREFVVPGHPVPYLRMTQGQTKLLKIPLSRLRPSGVALRNRIEKYFEWKSWVWSHAMAAGAKAVLTGESGKVVNRRAKLDVRIYFGSLHHGDPDNIRKGIQDALFEKDKFISGCVDFDYDKKNPRCIVKIILQEKSMKGETDGQKSESASE